MNLRGTWSPSDVKVALSRFASVLSARRSAFSRSRRFDPLFAHRLTAASDRSPPVRRDALPSPSASHCPLNSTKTLHGMRFDRRRQDFLADPLLSCSIFDLLQKKLKHIGLCFRTCLVPQFPIDARKNKRETNIDSNQLKKKKKSIGVDVSVARCSPAVSADASSATHCLRWITLKQSVTLSNRDHEILRSDKLMHPWKISSLAVEIMLNVLLCLAKGTENGKSKGLFTNVQIDFQLTSDTRECVFTSVAPCSWWGTLKQLHKQNKKIILESQEVDKHIQMEPVRQFASCKLSNCKLYANAPR